MLCCTYEVLHCLQVAQLSHQYDLVQTPPRHLSLLSQAPPFDIIPLRPNTANVSQAWITVDKHRHIQRKRDKYLDWPDPSDGLTPNTENTEQTQTVTGGVWLNFAIL